MENTNIVNSPAIVDKTTVVTLKITKVDGGTVYGNYATLSGNKPNAFSNRIGFWGGDEITDRAEMSILLDNDKAVGDFIFSGLPIQEKNYILGYCQTGKNADPVQNDAACKNVSASAVFTQNGSSNVDKKLGLELSGDSSQMTLKYKLLPNMTDKGHWIGFWEGDAEISGRTLVKSSEKSQFFSIEAIRTTIGTAITKVGLTAGCEYKMGYFVNGFNTSSDTLDVTNMIGMVKFKV